MRDNFTADWAFGIQGAIENVVRENFPSQLRQWPLLQSFVFEAYQVDADHFVMVLRDRLSGIPAGPSKLKPFPYEDHPSLPLSQENVTVWLSYLIARFSLRNEDAAMVLPIYDSGQHDAVADYEMFSNDEKTLWTYELQFFSARMKSALEGPIDAHMAPATPAHATYIVSGTNARVNINTLDDSVKVVELTPPEVLEQLLAAVRGTKADAEVVAAMMGAVEDMQRDYGNTRFLEHYKTFISMLADHFQVFGPIVIPYLPSLTKLLPYS